MAATVQNVGVDHGRANVLVAQQLLHRADIVTSNKQVGGEGMSKRVASQVQKCEEAPAAAPPPPPIPLFVDLLTSTPLPYPSLQALGAGGIN